MSHRTALAALACAGILVAATATPAAQAAPPDHVQQRNQERRAARELARTCAHQDLTQAVLDQQNPLPVRCTEGFPAELEVTRYSPTSYAGFEVVLDIDHEGPLFIWFGDTPVYWTNGPDFTWYDGDTAQVPADQLGTPQRLAYYDVHGDLVAWRWLTILGW